MNQQMKTKHHSLSNEQPEFHVGRNGTPRLRPGFRKPAFALLALALLTQFAAPSAFAQTIHYWDNQTGAGFGTAGGTWSSSGNAGIPGWSTDSTGNTDPSGANIITGTTDTSENFGSVTAGLATGTISVSGAVNAGSNIVFGAASGNITLSGGTSITLPATATITVNNASNTISTPILGAGTSLTLNGGGTLNLSGANTYTGSTTVGNGTLVISGKIYNALAPASATTVSVASGSQIIINAAANNVLGYGAHETWIVNGTLANISAANTETLPTGGVIMTNGTMTGINNSSGYGPFYCASGSPMTITANGANNIISAYSIGYAATMTFNTPQSTDALSLSSVLGVGARNTGGLTKTGLGTLTLTGASIYTGATAINGGTLQLGNGGATGTLSTSSAISVGTGATFAVNRNNAVTQGTDFKNAPITGLGGFAQLGSGNTTLNAANSYSGPTTISAGTLTIGGAGMLGSGSYAGAITNNGALNYNSSAIQTLSGIISGTGLITVSSGEIKFSTAGSATAPITTAAGATSGVLAASTGGQWVNTGNLTYQNSSVMHIDFSSFTPSTTTAPMNVANLTLGTGLTMTISDLAPGFAVSQNYPLVTWTGSGPADATAFTTLVLPGGISGNLTVSGNTLYLNVTANTGALTWNTASGTWDTTTSNWLSGGVATAYADNVDSVTFDDAAGVIGNPTVTLNSTFSPAGMLMSSTNHSYTISGSGGISGNAALVLGPANTQTLTLSTSDSYTGGTVVNAGTLVLGSANAIGTGTLTLSGGNLDSSVADLVNANNNAQSWNADFTFVGSQNLNLGTGAVTPSTNRQVTVTANTLTVGGAIGGAFSLTTAGAGTLELSGVNTYAGNTTVSNGTLLVSGTGDLYSAGQPTSPTTVSVASGAQIILSGTVNNALGLGPNCNWIVSGTINSTGGAAQTLPPTVTLNNGTLTGNDNASYGAFYAAGSTPPTITANGANNSINVPIIGTTATITFNTPLATDALTNSAAIGIGIRVTGGVTKTGLGTVTLTGANIYTGFTTISNGTLTIGDPGQLGGGTYAAAITNYGVFNYSSSASQTLSGNIAGTGSLVMNSVGATLTLSGTNTYTGNITISAGTLELAQSFATLATSSTVTIASGAQLQLDVASVTNQVGRLVTNGVAAGNGLYSSANSSGFITGSGYLQVAAPSGPAMLTSSVSGGVLSLSWPAGQGWLLEYATNLVSTNWLPVTDSSVSSTNITIDPTQPSVFYRLVYP
jgi:autotransporter-associated beta strand protein